MGSSARSDATSVGDPEVKGRRQRTYRAIVPKRCQDVSSCLDRGDATRGETRSMQSPDNAGNVMVSAWCTSLRTSTVPSLARDRATCGSTAHPGVAGKFALTARVSTPRQPGHLRLLDCGILLPGTARYQATTLLTCAQVCQRLQAEPSENGCVASELEFQVVVRQTRSAVQDVKGYIVEQNGEKCCRFADVPKGLTTTC